MIRKLNKFDTTTEYQKKKELIPPPHIGLINDNKNVFYQENVTTTTTSGQPTVTPTPSPKPNQPAYTTGYVHTTSLIPLIYYSDKNDVYDESIDGKIQSIIRGHIATYQYFHNVTKYGNVFTHDISDLYVMVDDNLLPKYVDDLNYLEFYAEPDLHNSGGIYKITFNSVTVRNKTLYVDFINNDDWGAGFNVYVRAKNNKDACYTLGHVFIVCDDDHLVAGAFTRNPDGVIQTTAEPTTPEPTTPTPTPSPTPSPFPYPVATKYPTHDEKVDVYPQPEQSSGYRGGSFTGAPFQDYNGEKICYVKDVVVDKVTSCYTPDKNERYNCEFGGFITVVLEDDHTERTIRLSDENLTFDLYDLNGNKYYRHPSWNYIIINLNQSYPNYIKLQTNNLTAGSYDGSVLIIGAKIKGFDYGSYAETEFIPVHYIYNVQ